MLKILEDSYTIWFLSSTPSAFSPLPPTYMSTSMPIQDITYHSILGSKITFNTSLLQRTQVPLLSPGIYSQDLEIRVMEVLHQNITEKVMSFHVSWLQTTSVTQYV